MCKKKYYGEGGSEVVGISSLTRSSVSVVRHWRGRRWWGGDPVDNAGTDNSMPRYPETPLWPVMPLRHSL
jgi:hypothetical protein